MPGIFGAQKVSERETLPILAKNMSMLSDEYSNMTLDCFIDEKGGVCLGRTSIGAFNSVSQPVKNQNKNCMIIFHGEIYNNPGILSDPEYVLDLYVEHGDKAVSRLNGIFHFVIYDKALSKIKLFSDKFGLQPVYYSISKTGFVFASEVRTILKESTISREPDFNSFADFLHFGQILGNKTLFKNIKLLAPGSILTYDSNKHNIIIEKYWILEDIFVSDGNYDVSVSAEDVVSLFSEAVKIRTKNPDTLGLSLSGGLDSRGILAALGNKAKGLQTYTLGLPGCADQKLAEMMSKIAGTKHEFVELDQNYLKNFESMANNMIRLSDGMYHPHESTEMLALEYFKRAGFRVLLRGHGGEIAKASLAYPVMVHKNVYAMTNSDEILNYISNITNLVIRDNKPEKLFTSAFYKNTKGAARESLNESCFAASKKLAPADLCIYYYINEHIRRQVVASLEIFRTSIEIRLPYVDEKYISLLLKIPVSKRNSGEIHYEVIKKCMPSLIKIPNSNTGAPLDAGQLRLFFADKYSSLMKKLSVSGFRHYTEFQDWQRKSFKKTTEDILSSKQLRERDIYDPIYLKNIFDDHISGNKNYAHLLGTIVGLELWFRNFVD